jgi:hypothetical protein
MTMTRNIEFKAIEFSTAGEAIQHADASGGEAVRIHGRNMVVDSRTLGMLDNARVEFAYLFNHQLPDGSHRIVTVPVNG